MSWKHFFSPTLTILSLCFANQLLFGQAGQITGVVTDPSGAAVPDAIITATNVDTGTTRTTSTTTGGVYALPQLQPGTYNVTVEKAAFKSMTTSGLKLDVAAVTRVDFTLQLGQEKQAIEVIADSPLLKTEGASVSQVINNAQVLDLPLNGREWTQLATLVPGAISQARAGFFDTPNLSINGGRASTMVYMVGGINSAEQFWTGASLIPPIDAIQEFRVQTNSFSAEYGEGNAVVNVELKSGTNQYHGSAWEFLRNDKLDARNFFALEKPPLRQNQFGFTIGGPLTIPGILNGKNRHFFFADYEGTRIRRSTTFNTPAASVAMRNGDFAGLPTITDPDTGLPFPNNQIPQDRLSPQALFFLPYIPTPNTPEGTFSFSPVDKNDGDKFDIRTDHKISDSDSIEVDYDFLQRNIGGSHFFGRTPFSGATNTPERIQAVRLGETHTFGSHMVNDFRFGFLRTRMNTRSQGLGTNYTVQSGIGGFDETSLENPSFPDLIIGFQYTGVTGGAFYPINETDNKYDIVDNLNMVLGKHVLKAGYGYRSFQTYGHGSAWDHGFFLFVGAYAGDSFADYLLGLPLLAFRSFPRNYFGEKGKNHNFYVQDDWKISPKVTLNVGLRYELNYPPEELYNAISSFDPATGNIVVGTDSSGQINLTAQQVTPFVYPLFSDIIVTDKSVGLPVSLRHLDQNDFAPRVGLAWQVTPHTVTRAGYGVYYVLSSANRTRSTAIGGPPFLADEQGNFNSFPPTKDLSNMFLPIANGLNLTPLQVYSIDPNARTPYLQQWNLSVQHLVKGVLSLEAAYVGSKGTKLDFSRPFNIPDPGPGDIQGRRPFTRFGPGSVVEWSQNSTYSAFQAKAEIRGWRGLSTLASYTYGKSLDTESGDPQTFTASIENPNNLGLEKGPSNFDVRHRFVINFVYDLPFGRGLTGIKRHLLLGWQVGSIITKQTGFPFNPTSSIDTANTGIVQRPDRIGSGDLGSSRTLDRDFDVSAFQLPADFTFGTSGRNILYARGFTNWDAIVAREFRLGENAKLLFRAEFFNFTNTPAFGPPVTDIGSPAAGQILSAGEPRDIQLGLKLLF